jgi:adenylate cyclase
MIKPDIRTTSASLLFGLLIHDSANKINQLNMGTEHIDEELKEKKPDMDLLKEISEENIEVQRSLLRHTIDLQDYIYHKKLNLNQISLFCLLEWVDINHLLGNKVNVHLKDDLKLDILTHRLILAPILISIFSEFDIVSESSLFLTCEVIENNSVFSCILQDTKTGNVIPYRSSCHFYKNVIDHNLELNKAILSCNQPKITFSIKFPTI